MSPTERLSLVGEVRELTVDFRCIYSRLKMVVRPKHVVDNRNRIVNNY
jgi:hypothetical protein